MPDVTAPCPLRPLTWSAGDWLGRGVGGSLMAVAAGHLFVGWVLCATIYSWLGDGREWIAGTGLYCTAMGMLTLVAGVRAVRRGAAWRGARIATAVIAWLSVAPVALLLWNLGPGWHEDSPLWNWTFDTNTDRLLLAIVVGHLLVAAGAGLFAALPVRSVAANPVAVSRARLALTAVAILAPTLALGSTMPSEPYDEAMRATARLQYRLSWADRWSRWIDDHDHCKWIAVNGLIPGAMERDIWIPGEPVQYLWEAGELAAADDPLDAKALALLRQALEDRHYGADDRVRAVKLLRNHPERRRKLLPTLVRLMESGEVSAIGAAVGYPSTEDERRELQRSFEGELKRAATHMYADATGTEPRMVVVPQRLRPAQKITAPEDDVLAFPGRGFSGVIVGYSTAEEVLAALGDDGEVTLYHDGDPMRIRYRTPRSGQSGPDRRGAPDRPNTVWFKDGFVESLQFGVYQTEVFTLGDIQHGSPLDQVIKTFGNAFEHRSGRRLDTYRWPHQGIEFWVNRDTEQVNSFKIVANK